MIIDLLPKELIVLLKDIQCSGFSFCLVGGFPRDYFLAKKMSHDLDFEIRPALDRPPISPSEWDQYYERLLNLLESKKIKYKRLPYLITRIEFGEFNLEFTSPRIEINRDNEHGHHHFTAVLNPNLTYEESFKRRDFTINAIGIELDMVQNREFIIDPYGGREDLLNGLLKNISQDFFFDSVRFLRLIRFQLKFKKFIMQESLADQIGNFNLSKLSLHHFTEELLKSNPGEFLNLFVKLIKEHNLVIPKTFAFWSDMYFPDDLQTKDDILAYVLIAYNLDYAQKVAVFFSLPNKKLRDLKSFIQSFESIIKLTKKEVANFLKLPLNEALSSPILKELKNLEEKKEYKSFFKLSYEDLIISWADWEKVKVEFSEIEQLKVSDRSYYLFYKALKLKFQHE